MSQYGFNVNFNQSFNKCASVGELTVYIRGVTGGTDQTSGGCSLC